MRILESFRNFTRILGAVSVSLVIMFITFCFFAICASAPMLTSRLIPYLSAFIPILCKADKNNPPGVFPCRFGLFPRLSRGVYQPFGGIPGAFRKVSVLRQITIRFRSFGSAKWGKPEHVHSIDIRWAILDRLYRDKRGEKKEATACAPDIGRVS